MSPDAATALQVMFVVLTIIGVFAIILGIIAYIFRAIGLYSISRRRKLGTSGFAWIPILNLFKLGQIADDAVLNKKGVKPHFMVFYPVSQLAGSVIISVGSFLYLYAFGFSGNLNTAIQSGRFDVIFRMRPRPDLQAVYIIGIILLVIGLLLVLFSSVLYYVCLYHIYRSCTKSWIPFFVLSFFFSIVIPFFLFALRKKDNPDIYRSRNYIEDPLVTEPYL